ncbi:hypothetical protein [Streptomyces sp. NPDC047725]
MHAEAHDLPFGEGTFDAVVGIGSVELLRADEGRAPGLARVVGRRTP